ncbi:hypothetical protein ACFQE0_23375 [Methylobacterium komagatae]|uniref:CopL family metal-binding regulatory protein n=1 Tax=Methylobacterium komagatae TaxID=374425 RepID=A0ABW2BQ20_9HYPH
MTLWLALRRLLPLLAVLSLALTPVAAPAATAGMHASIAHAMAGMDPSAMAPHEAASAGMDMADGMSMDDMPCCPKADAPKSDALTAHAPKPVSSKPDCAKGCPLMALCLAGAASLLPTSVPIPVPAATRAKRAWPEPGRFASVHGTPYPEPPRA